MVLVLLTCAGCDATDREPPITPVRIATGGSDGVSFSFGETLARVHNETGGSIRLTAEASAGSTYNVDALDDGKVDLALARADVVYTAYVNGTPTSPRPHTRLRGLASLWGSALHVVVRADSPARTLSDLRRLPVGMGVAAAGVSPVIAYGDLLAASGRIAREDIRSERLVFDELMASLASGRIAAAFLLGGYPIEGLNTFAATVQIRLLEIPPDAATRIRAVYPFYKPTTIPGHIYDGQPEPVATVAVENLLVTRENLEEQLVYDLASRFFASLPRVAHDHATALQIDPDLASATPIPLHPGAARYYRERELLK